MFKIIWKDHQGKSHEAHKTSTYDKAEEWVMRQTDADIRKGTLRSYIIQDLDSLMWGEHGT